MRRTVKSLVTLVTVLLLLFVARVIPAPAEITPAPAPAPEPTPTPTEEKVNFRFLISDDVNAIEDFEQLWVHITSIGVQKGGESGNWTEPEDFVPVKVDLKQLIADNATEIWSGNLTPGVYSKVFIHVDNITSVPAANIKLPSEKLQISKPFEVVDGEVTNFVYDLTIIKAGKSGQYILKPQIAESGSHQPFNLVTPKGKPEDTGRPEDKGKPEGGEAEEFEGTIEAIAGDNWTMTIDDEEWTVDVSGADIEGEPAVGLEAEVKGTVVDSTIVASEVEIKEEE